MPRSIGQDMNTPTYNLTFPLPYGLLTTNLEKEESYYSPVSSFESNNYSGSPVRL